MPALDPFLESFPNGLSTFPPEEEAMFALRQGSTSRSGEATASGTADAPGTMPAENALPAALATAPAPVNPGQATAAAPAVVPKGPHHGKRLDRDQTLAALKKGESLEGAVLRGKDGNSIKFEGEKFPAEANFAGADLTHVNFQSCTFTRADFRGAKLPANRAMSNGVFMRCSFKKCQFGDNSLGHKTFLESKFDKTSRFSLAQAGYSAPRSSGWVSKLISRMRGRKL